MLMPGKPDAICEQFSQIGLRKEMSLRSGQTKTWKLVWLAIGLITLGCGAPTPSPPIPSLPTPSAKHATVTPAALSSISLNQSGLDDIESNDARSRLEWTSESAHEAIDAQLKKLAKLLGHGQPIDGDSLKTLIADAFECSDLRPDNRNSAFRDEMFHVSRMAPSSTPLLIRKQGAEGFLAAVKHLVSPVESSSKVEVKFKTVRVELAGSECKTVVRYELRAPSKNKTLQQNATWQCLWRLAKSSPNHTRDRDLADVDLVNGSAAYQTTSFRGSPRLLSIRLMDFTEVVGSGLARPMFEDVARSVLTNNRSYRNQLKPGLDYWIDRIESRYGMNISGWQGVSVADVNGDDLEDVYLCQGGGLPNRLFLQNADGTAKDRSKESRVDWRDHSHGAIFADLDNDSDQDLVLGTALGLIIMANDGRGVFRTVAAKSTPEAAPLSLSVADFNDDGRLDIYAACYSIRNADTERSPFLGRPVPYHDANNGGRNILFRNEGSWRFRDVTQSVGLGENNRRFSMAASWEDFDNDGDMDLYVANDYGRNNLYQNHGGQFRDVAAESGVEDISAGMSVSWGDYNLDGHMDLYVSNMFSSAGNRIAFQRKFQRDASIADRQAFQRHARGNSLFQNVGDGSFRDVSVQAGVTMGRWAWGSKLADINNDGWDDILVANGFITQENPDDL